MSKKNETRSNKRPKKPKVNVTLSGRYYVDADELVNSKTGRREIKRTVRAMESNSDHKIRGTTMTDEQLAAALNENIDRVEDLMNEASDRGLYTDLDLMKIRVATPGRDKFLHSISLTLERREPVSSTTSTNNP